MKRILAWAGAAAFASLASAAATGSAVAAPTCENGTIPVGAVATITGIVNFSDAPNGAKAVFDALNAEGGIEGCKITYTIADDKGDPAVAAQAARDLIDNKGVVALAGSASLLDCAVNAGTYVRRGVMSVQGLGVDPLCFNAPSVAPVNVGPYTLTTAMGYFADTVLESEKLCAFFLIIGGTEEAYQEAIANYEKLSGKKIGFVDLTLPAQGDLTPYLIKSRDAGCDAVVTNAIEPSIVQWVNTADAQKIEGIDWLFLAPGYTEALAKALADTEQPIYIGTEWEPYTEASEANANWDAVMTEAGLPKTAFSQGGYLSANVLIDVIKGIDGAVTRESVTEALKTMEPISHPIAGSPYVFGDAPAHAPMQATKVMQLIDGEWVLKTQDWLVLPQQN
ncbi:MAG: ABC transporter substrate-binding protein [Rhizobiaceae bacterium]|nr:ABC transporter substrate-binding protein [Rhizobiaceae bacterium]MCV0408375.1 ABC transporter substrate-binding protein [Rhizobiaceae bacterium]